MNFEEAEGIFQARIQAAGTVGDGPFGRGLSEDTIRKVISDLDIDFDELMEQAETRAQLAMVATVTKEAEPPVILSGLFFQGFVMATLMERAKASA